MESQKSTKHGFPMLASVLVVSVFVLHYVMFVGHGFGHLLTSGRDPLGYLFVPAPGSAAHVVAQQLIGLNFGSVCFCLVGALLPIRDGSRSRLDSVFRSAAAGSLLGVCVHLAWLAVGLLHRDLWSAAVSPDIGGFGVFVACRAALAILCLLSAVAAHGASRASHTTTTTTTPPPTTAVGQLLTAASWMLSLPIFASHTFAAIFDITLATPAPPFLRSGVPCTPPFEAVEVVLQNVVGLVHIPAVVGIVLSVAGAVRLRDATLVAALTQAWWAVLMVADERSWLAVIDPAGGLSYPNLLVLHCVLGGIALLSFLCSCVAEWMQSGAALKSLPKRD